MAESLYLSMGKEALEVLESKLATGSHLMDEDERQYAKDVAVWFRSLGEQEDRLQAGGLN